LTICQKLALYAAMWSLAQIHAPEQKTILIIEDEPAIRTMAAKAIHSFGYQTLEAEDGEKGIELFETAHASIDAILLDIILPKMSGIQTFEKILHIDPDASIIITSGHITNQDQKSIFAKARGFLEKPYQIMELKKMIHLALA